MATITGALAIAHAGDTIRVAAGTYTENVVVTQTVHLQGGWSPDFSLRDVGAFTATIYPVDNTRSVVTISGQFGDSSVVAPTLDGFMITEGRADQGSNHGGGLQIRDSDALVISNTISGNTAFFLGGGVWVQRGAPLLQGNAIISNTSVGLGQQAYGGGIQLEASQATLLDNIISGNIVSGTEAYGGGIDISSTGTGQVILRGNQVFSNTAAIDLAADGFGGAVAVRSGQVLVEDNLVLSNTAVTRGGGVYFSNAVVDLMNNSIVTNTALYGGGVYMSGDLEDCCSLAGMNNLIQDNRAAWGGGVFVGSIVDGCCTVTATNTLIQDNTAAEGGGLFNSNQYTAIIGSLIISNTASSNGGGLYLGIGGTAVLTYSAVIENVSTDNGGGFVNTGSLVTLTNSTISGNTANGMGGGVANFSDLYVSNSTVSDNTSSNGAGVFSVGNASMLNTLVANNTGDNCLGAMTSLGYNLEDGVTCALGQTTDISNTLVVLHPLGSNGGQTLVHALAEGNPGIDAGDNSSCPAVDQRGTPRPIDGDGDGIAVCDIGAYEFNQVMFEIYLSLLHK